MRTPTCEDVPAVARERFGFNVTETEFDPALQVWRVYSGEESSTARYWMGDLMMHERGWLHRSPHDVRGMNWYDRLGYTIFDADEIL